MKYIQSVEEYKGYRLELEMTTSHDHPSREHRRCIVTASNGWSACCKTKKEAKDLIDHNCFAYFERKAQEK